MVAPRHSSIFQLFLVVEGKASCWGEKALSHASRNMTDEAERLRPVPPSGSAWLRWKVCSPLDEREEIVNLRDARPSEHPANFFDWIGYVVQEREA